MHTSPCIVNCHNSALSLSLYMYIYVITGGSGVKPTMYPICEKLVFAKVKQALGLQHGKFGFTGAAPITFDTLSYFGALGLQINEVHSALLYIPPALYIYIHT